MKRPGAPRLTDEDRSLFAEAVRGAVPLPASEHHHRTGRRTLPPVATRPTALSASASCSSSSDPDLALEIGEEPSYVQPGVSRQSLRKLRRGHWVVQAELDLHGMRQPEAHRALAEFLASCLRRGHRCVRVVHGKGLGSVNREPVLKGQARGWLARRSEVLAFCQAPGTQGGSGALLVLLRG